MLAHLVSSTPLSPTPPPPRSAVLVQPEHVNGVLTPLPNVPAQTEESGIDCPVSVRLIAFCRQMKLGQVSRVAKSVATNGGRLLPSPPPGTRWYGPALVTLENRVPGVSLPKESQTLCAVQVGRSRSRLAPCIATGEAANLADREFGCRYEHGAGAAVSAQGGIARAFGCALVEQFFRLLLRFLHGLAISAKRDLLFLPVLLRVRNRAEPKRWQAGAKQGAQAGATSQPIQ